MAIMLDFSTGKSLENNLTQTARPGLGQGRFASLTQTICESYFFPGPDQAAHVCTLITISPYIGFVESDAVESDERADTD
jgi:hypothetical protein